MTKEFRKQTEEAKFEAFSLMCKKVADLEAEVKEWKDKADLWCKTANLKDHNIMINKELEKENAELKKQVEKHKWNDIFLEDCADYDKKIAEEYTTLQERIADLKKENAELKEMIQEMYFLLRNYDKFFLGDRLLKCFEKVENYNFLKDSEVEK